MGRPKKSPGPADLRGAVLPHLLGNLLSGRPGLLFPNGTRPYVIAETRRFDEIQIIPDKRTTLRSLDAEKAQRAMLLADTSGLDGVVVLIDREKPSQPDRAARLREGREHFRAAGGRRGPGCAVGVACRCVETWLLADDEARAGVLGSGAGSPFSQRPEDRPAPQILKRYIEKHAAIADLDQADAREQLAKAARPQELRRRCPASYAPFAADVEAEIAPLARK